MGGRMTKILVTGAVGQIGSELTLALRKKYGGDNVIGTVHRAPPSDELKETGPMETVDATDKEALKAIIEKHNIDTIYHLVSLLSAVGEKKPDLAWHINMTGLKNVLDLAVEYKIKRVFWPSSIAAFGPSAKKDGTPQDAMLDPNTMYGVTKVAGELLCNYYFNKYGLDVRSLRYPGLVSYKTEAGGGTTDYAVEIYYEAIRNGQYECFLNEGTALPMLFMHDAIKATIQLMEADRSRLTIHCSYNVGGISVTPAQMHQEIQKHIPGFTIRYNPDFRQAIADTWPHSVDDTIARVDWGFEQSYDLEKITTIMLKEVGNKLKL